MSTKKRTKKANKVVRQRYVGNVMFSLTKADKHYLNNQPLQDLVFIRDERPLHPTFFKTVLLRLSYLKEGATYIDQKEQLGLLASLALHAVQGWFKRFKDTGLCEVPNPEYDLVRHALEHGEQLDELLYRIELKNIYEAQNELLERDPMLRYTSHQ